MSKANPVKALIHSGLQRNRERGLTIFGIDLKDAREEVFVRMICDGLAIGIAFTRAGFQSPNKHAAYDLWHLPRIQERASKILEARRSTGVVTLGEVTDMLQRVFAGAHAAEEFSAAHNAAFSLARIYGHVTDKSVIEHIRRPSRDPDAPSETALEDWAASLPVVSPEKGLSELSQGPFQGPPAALLGPECITPTTQPDVVSFEPSVDGSAQGPGLGDGGARTGNGAPVGPVTGTPYAGGRTAPGPGFEKGPPPNEMRVPVPPWELLGVANEPPAVPGYGEGVDWQTRVPAPRKENQPPEEKQVPVPTGGWPPIEDLF